MERSPAKRFEIRGSGAGAGLRSVFCAIAILALPCSAIAQTQTQTEPVREWPLVTGLIVVEAVAFGSAALARSETGARAVGAIQGASAVAALAIATFGDGDTGWPEFMVPYGVGLLGLSYYNFSASGSSRRSERFWTNAIGLNVVLAASALSAVVWPRSHDMTRVRASVVPAGITVIVPF